MTAASRMWSTQSRLDREAADPTGTKRAVRPGFRPLPGCSPVVPLGSHIIPHNHPPPPAHTHTRAHTHTHVHAHPAKAPFWAEKSALTQPTRLFTAVNSKVTGWLLLRLSVALDPNTDPLSGPCRPQDVKWNIGGQVIQTDGNSGLNGTRNRSKPNLLSLTS